MAEAAFDVVRVDPTLWRVYRDVRLAALIDSPRAFGSTYAQVAERPDAGWREFVTNAVLWLAMAGQRPLGTIGLYDDPDLRPDQTYLVGMWVASGARGHGVGDRLVDAALREARTHGKRQVVLEVSQDNDPAIGLYARHGFVPTGRLVALGRDATIVEQEMVADLHV